MAKSLVVVLGAGASNEVHLPLGSELMQKIDVALAVQHNNYGELVFSSRILEQATAALAKRVDAPSRNLSDYYLASEAIREGMSLAPSIDNFIDIHRDNPVVAACGKLAIALCILKAEHGSPLRYDTSNANNTINFGNLDNTWFNAFFRLLTINRHKNDLAEHLRRITIINFNYDRCVEQYLYHALQRLYQESPSWAAETMKALDIYHPYGRVGALPWMSERPKAEYGVIPSPETLVLLSKDLLTFTEGTDAKKSDIECIRRDMAEAKRVAFLGFAFHRLNLELLFDGRTDGSIQSGRPIFATAIGISDFNCEAISSEIKSRSGRGFDTCILRNGLRCAKLIDEYSWGLVLK